ncbi:phage holin family protein [Thiohalomonas denitrificans]|uniref:Putative Holin-X, holin superfamily III n=1 Tax=Thiohalomonas denitrificans TaxID=415747 RepID=A0A1G5QXP4_9GAMM|nr:phage holin family protein [Thiohalomonas denitrificans]SCZ66644.1 Putative Holin-X, holin superfamily III [Thiohalomonas denitrificans]
MANSDKSLASLIADLSRETSTLVRDEVHLAKAEMSEKVDQVTSGAVSILTGALVAFSGLLVLLWAATVVLAELIEPWTTQPWVAPLIVGVVVALVGLIILQSGRKKVSAEGLKPHHTIDSFKRDRQVLKG